MMAMSKHDYVILANTFRQALKNNGDIPNAPDVNKMRAAARGGIEHTLVLLCDQLADDNPRFDRRKFLFAATGSHDMHLKLLQMEVLSED
jgi:hypothetical protein